MSFLTANSIAQNDLDAIRFSRTGVGGGARFTAMGGAFGALGADISCAAYNPAGLALFRGGDIQYSGSIKSANTTANLYNTKSALSNTGFVFNNFGVLGAWPSEQDPENRHIFAFSNTQIQNFRNSVKMGGYTNSNSIARDMLHHAEGKSLSDLNNSYEGLAYDTYLIDFDSTAGSYFSFVDVKRTVLQNRELITSGRVNDLNFSYAYTYKDRFYLGASIGVPQVKYESTLTHTEADDLDSMRVEVTSDTSFTSTYTDELPFVYSGKLGFNNMLYEEYFKTAGGGLNFKIGGIVRINDLLRVGAYFHSRTVYKLSDEYYNFMSVAFDKAKSSPEEETYPAEGGIYSYKISTPAKLGLNAGFIFQKKAALAIDYELLNYSKASLRGSNSSDFSEANELIGDKYSVGHNFRIGTEINYEPVKFRAGYAMYGSPFGKAFSGEQVRNTFSLGFGYKTSNNLYFDVVLAHTVSREKYYPFLTLDAGAQVALSSTVLGLTMGFRF